MSTTTDYMGLTLYDPYNTDAYTEGRVFVQSIAGAGTDSDLYKINQYMKGKATILIKTAAQWEADTETILRPNDIGLASDTDIYKRGDGASTWSNLTTIDMTYSNFKASGYTGTKAQFYSLLNSISAIASNLNTLADAVDGKAPTSHASSSTSYGVSNASDYGHAKASETTPKAPGTATLGNETSSFARGDHVHPSQTSITGNAGTATKLATARTISLTGDVTGTVSFNGSANASIAATIGDGKVTEAKLNTDAVTTGKIKDGNVTSEKIADDAIGNNKLSHMNARTLKGNNTNAAAGPTDIPADDALSMIGANEKFQYTAMPSTVTEGKIIQFIGTTSASYKNGSFYKGQSGVWTELQFGGYVDAGGAGAHNSVYRGKNVQSKLTDGSLYTEIENGTFDDLYIGDYFDITISTAYIANETVRCVFAGFDTYLNCGDTPLTTHHAVIVPFNCFTATSVMNPSTPAVHSTEGAYFGSAVHTTVLPAYATALRTIFGNRLLTYRDLLTNTMTAATPSMAGLGYTGAATSWAWYDCTLRLMSEPEVYGTTVFSSSAMDIGCAKTQLPYFRFRPDRIVCGLGGTSDSTRAHWWLSSVASSTAFAGVFADGVASAGGAAYAFGVRPRFLIS